MTALPSAVLPVRWSAAISRNGSLSCAAISFSGVRLLARRLDLVVDGLDLVASTLAREVLPESPLRLLEGACLATLVAPALLVIAVFFLLPVLAGFALSVTDFDLYALADIANLRFVGLDNYVRLLQSAAFWQALGNTLYFVVVGVPLSIGVSLGAALLLNSRLTRFKAFFRTALFAPVVTTLVAVAVVWRYLFHTRYGVINYWLGSVGVPPVDWLGDPHWAMPTIILLAVWKNFGYNMVIFLASLQAIPEDLYEAARIDGASWWRQIIHITLPMLAPTLTWSASSPPPVTSSSSPSLT